MKLEMMSGTRMTGMRVCKNLLPSQRTMNTAPSKRQAVKYSNGTLRMDGTINIGLSAVTVSNIATARKPIGKYRQARTIAGIIAMPARPSSELYDQMSTAKTGPKL